MKIYGHRGASGYAPENTIAAFQLAYLQNANGLELDVQLTRDGHVVVIHDEFLNRTSNGKGLVMEKTLEELKALDFGSWYSDEFKDEKIPTLNEVMEWIAPTGLELNIEIKTAPVVYNHELVEKVYEAIDRYDLYDKVIVSSFDHKAVKEIKGMSPRIKTGILYAANIIDVAQYAKKVGADYIHPQSWFVDEAIVKECKAANIGINVWTVNEESEMAWMNALKVDTIISNYPKMAVEQE